ncbi:MAG: hypothetical protein ACLPOO_16730 [Terriglobales bacterium]
MSTAPHPAHMFTESQASAFNAEIKTVLDARAKRHAEAAARPKPKRQPITYTGWFDAKTALDRFEMIPDPQKKLDEVHGELNDQYLLEEELCRILASDPTDYEKRKILGWEEKHKSVPGFLDSYFHVDGSLEKCRAKIADLEKKIPRLKIVVEDYVHVKESFKAWPRPLINKLKTEELDRQLIAGGKLPQGSHRQNLRSARSTEFVPAP